MQKPPSMDPCSAQLPDDASDQKLEDAIAAAYDAFMADPKAYSIEEVRACLDAEAGKICEST